MAQIIKTRNDLLKLIKPDSKIAELGVYEGVFSEDILNICNPKLLYLVDLWSGGASRNGDKDGLNPIYHDSFDKVFEIVQSKFSEFWNVELRKESTINFLNSIPDKYLDAVYIDANHTYDDVKKELNLSIRKVKKGGLIMGHDYAIRTSGVVKAVDEFCKSNKLQINYLTQDLIPSFCIINE